MSQIEDLALRQSVTNLTNIATQTERQNTQRSGLKEKFHKRQKFKKKFQTADLESGKIFNSNFRNNHVVSKMQSNWCPRKMATG
jgi:hypothetical protein